MKQFHLLLIRKKYMKRANKNHYGKTYLQIIKRKLIIIICNLILDNSNNKIRVIFLKVYINKQIITFHIIVILKLIKMKKLYKKIRKMLL